MKYTTSRIVMILFYAAATAIALTMYDSGFAVKIAAVSVPLIAGLIFALWLGKKHPEFKMWNGLFENRRTSLVRLSSFIICLPLLFFFSSGRSMACAILTMWGIDSVYRFIVAKKLEIDELKTAEAVLEKHPEAVKYLNYGDIEKTGKQ